MTEKEALIEWSEPGWKNLMRVRKTHHHEEPFRDANGMNLNGMHRDVDATEADLRAAGFVPAAELEQAQTLLVQSELDRDQAQRETEAALKEVQVRNRDAVRYEKERDEARYDALDLKAELEESEHKREVEVASRKELQRLLEKANRKLAETEGERDKWLASAEASAAIVQQTQGVHISWVHECNKLTDKLKAAEAELERSLAAGAKRIGELEEAIADVADGFEQQGKHGLASQLRQFLPPESPSAAPQQPAKIQLKEPTPSKMPPAGIPLLDQQPATPQPEPEHECFICGDPVPEPMVCGKAECIAAAGWHRAPCRCSDCVEGGPTRHPDSSLNDSSESAEPTPAVTLPALPISESDERIVDDLMAKAQAGRAETPMAASPVQEGEHIHDNLLMGDRATCGPCHASEPVAQPESAELQQMRILDSHVAELIELLRYDGRENLVTNVALTGESLERYRERTAAPAQPEVDHLAEWKIETHLRMARERAETDPASAILHLAYCISGLHLEQWAAPRTAAIEGDPWHPLIR